MSGHHSTPAETRAEAVSQIGFSTPRCAGKEHDNIPRFFFVFENVVASRVADADESLKLLCFLQGSAFGFIYKSFAADGNISEERRDNRTVMDYFIRKFR